MSDTKLVKVDNWGIHFLQRLKYFFNRTDYCDLTLQFQDNAQLKVHRLVLNACTEYFELLERTCEMYEDCLVMPDDLQADVVVPIVNFMYTGQLEFRQESLERLFQTSQIMNIPVLTKLLDAQRQATIKRPRPSVTLSASNSLQMKNVKQNYAAPSKRSYNKAFENDAEPSKRTMKKVTYIPPLKPGQTFSQGQQQVNAQSQPKPTKTNSNFLTLGTPISLVKSHSIYKKPKLTEPKPTRYEVPDEIDPDTVTCDSFTSISYDSRPLMIHPEVKPEKRTNFGIFSDPTTSFSTEGSVMDVECRRIDNDEFFDEHNAQTPTETFERKNVNNLFDQVVLESNEGPKVTVEAQDPKQAANIDHAKIISEVLKKYPHLVNSNKNIKLKILDTQTKPERKNASKKRPEPAHSIKKEYQEDKPEMEAYETDVLDSKQAAKLIAMGAENVKGPWICLICGTPGKAINFPSYFKFRRHLVDIHNEKPIPNLCEYCGFRSNKRNYLLHHLYTKHDVPPPRPYHFPKCNQCPYIALTSTALVKHKSSHVEVRTFRCNVCFDLFKTSSLLLKHIQVTGHKYSAERKNDNQCIYCLKIFTRETNLLIHLKAQHKREAVADGIMDDSEEEEEQEQVVLPIKYEPLEQDDTLEVKYQIQERSDGEIRLTPAKQRILNSGFKQSVNQKVYSYKNVPEFVDQNVQELSPNDSSTNEDTMNDQVIQTCSNTNDNEEYVLPHQFNDLPPVQVTSIYSEPISDKNTTAQANVTKMVSKVKEQPIEIVQLTNEEQLIAPNHSVIYDSDGNPSKTLAVLTTLDSSNANEMMILPDGYQMNVSHSVDAKNNFVVVYSHSVDSNGKPQYIVNSQYGQPQLITTQIGQSLVPQIVQSPAVITPNYTIANTSESVTDAPVAIAPEGIEADYQAPFQQQQVIPDSNTILMSTESSVNDITQTNMQQAVMSEMNELQIMNQQEEIDTSEQQEDKGTSEQQEDMDTSEQQEETTEILEPLSESPDTLPSNTDNAIEPTNSEMTENDIGLTSNITHDEPEEVENECDEAEVEENEQIIEDSNENEEPVSEEMAPEDTENITESGPISPTYTQPDVDIDCEAPNQVETSQENNALLESNIEHVRNIEKAVALDWAVEEEDPTEDISEDKNLSAENITEVPISENSTAVSEVEESIESIQQEINQIKADSAGESDVQGDSNDTNSNEQVENIGKSEQAAPSNGTADIPQEKVSNLLSDWEETDSQETVDTSAKNCTESTETELTPKSTTTVVKTLDSSIKSLVNDWEEEEEEKT